MQTELAKFRLEDFELYKAARELRKRGYRVLRALPDIEKYCLGSQMRRAAVSITNNIAEGHGRWHFQENMQFCRIARGSIEELIDDFNVCLDEKYFSVTEIEAAKEDAYGMINRINSYLVYLRNTRQGHDKP
jgi:four helix bundle protein